MFEVAVCSYVSCPISDAQTAYNFFACGGIQFEIDMTQRFTILLHSETHSNLIESWWKCGHYKSKRLRILEYFVAILTLLVSSEIYSNSAADLLYDSSLEGRLRQGRPSHEDYEGREWEGEEQGLILSGWGWFITYRFEKEAINFCSESNK